MNQCQVRRLAGGLAIVLGGVFAVAMPISAADAPSTGTSSALYVSTHASSSGAGTSCTTAKYTTIAAGLAAAGSGDTVVVCAGTYSGGVSITKPVDLVGENASIMAAGAANGIKVTASSVTIEGFLIKGATGEAIYAVGTASAPLSQLAIQDNVVVGNDVGNLTGGPISNSSYAQCNATPQPAPAPPIPGDCGEGIHLDAVTHSVVSGNYVADNSGGILLTDDVGPTDHNVIAHNDVLYNTLDCGITLASHSSKGFVNGKTVPSAGGLYQNTIAGNLIVGNGLIGEGGGVLLATPVPGGAVYDNTVAKNVISGNGLAGVTVHSHAPGQDLNGNVITANLIDENNIAGDFDFTPHVDSATTGVIVASAHDQISIEVSNNFISNNVNGIWTTGPVTLVHVSTNVFNNVSNPTATG